MQPITGQVRLCLGDNSMTLEERVRHRAYELWEEAGRPAGRAEEFWRQARAEVEAEIMREQDQTRRSTSGAAMPPVSGSVRFQPWLGYSRKPNTFDGVAACCRSPRRCW
jgi:Protein of unknown function (DUF2934)